MPFHSQSISDCSGAAMNTINVIVSLQFRDDVFGPVKALQLFAAVNELPSSYQVMKNESLNGWEVRLICQSTPHTERVLAKLSAMPSVLRILRVVHNEPQPIGESSTDEAGNV